MSYGIYDKTKIKRVSLNDVLNNETGIKDVKSDNEYYYIFPDYKSGLIEDCVYMVNKKDSSAYLTTVLHLIDSDILNTLENIPINTFKDLMSIKSKG